jgi:hypothetical protein
MTNPPDKPKRWRPRFSVRTLAVVVTLVCAYAACWGPTKRVGVSAAHNAHSSPDILVGLGIETTMVVSPFVIAITDSGHDAVGQHHESTAYYFWFFGYVAKLPYEREVQSDDDISHYLESATQIP